MHTHAPTAEADLFPDDSIAGLPPMEFVGVLTEDAKLSVQPNDHGFAVVVLAANVQRDGYSIHAEWRFPADKRVAAEIAQRKLKRGTEVAIRTHIRDFRLTLPHVASIAPVAPCSPQPAGTQ